MSWLSFHALTSTLSLPLIRIIYIRQNEAFGKSNVEMLLLDNQNTWSDANTGYIGLLNQKMVSKLNFNVARPKKVYKPILSLLSPLERLFQNIHLSAPLTLGALTTYSRAHHRTLDVQAGVHFCSLFGFIFWISMGVVVLFSDYRTQKYPRRCGLLVVISEDDSMSELGVGWWVGYCFFGWTDGLDDWNVSRWRVPFYARPRTVPELKHCGFFT